MLDSQHQGQKTFVMGSCDRGQQQSMSGASNRAAGANSRKENPRTSWLVNGLGPVEGVMHLVKLYGARWIGNRTREDSEACVEVEEPWK